MSTKIMLSKFFLADRQKWHLGSENCHFRPKTSSFGQKWRFLVVQKFSKKFFFVFFYILDNSLSCLMKTKKFGPRFGPFWSPLAHSVHRAVPGLASKLRYLLDEKVKVFSILARPKMLPVHSSSTLHTSFSFCQILF